MSPPAHARPITGSLEIVEIIVHLASGPVHVPAHQLLEWAPGVPALSFRTADDRLHSFNGCAFEVIYEESRIARPT